ALGLALRQHAIGRPYRGAHVWVDPVPHDGPVVDGLPGVFGADLVLVDPGEQELGERHAVLLLRDPIRDPIVCRQAPECSTKSGRIPRVPSPSLPCEPPHQETHNLSVAGSSPARGTSNRNETRPTLELPRNPKRDPMSIQRPGLIPDGQPPASGHPDTHPTSANPDTTKRPHPAEAERGRVVRGARVRRVAASRGRSPRRGPSRGTCPRSSPSRRVR